LHKNPVHLHLNRYASRILKKTIVSVTNDLSTDQRVDKVCRTLSGMGFQVLLVGRWLPGCLPLNDRPYQTHRMRLIFRRGPLFYAEYNFRLLLFLLFHPIKLLVSNDLDTLPANFIAHKLKHVPLVYDSHEYYTETPELVNRPLVQGIWERIEKAIFPQLKDIITVNQSIAALYQQKYNKKLYVVRNIPQIPVIDEIASRETLGLPADKKIIVLQGAGINIQRGAEETVEAMQYVPNALLLIIGGGDVIASLKKQVDQSGLSDKVKFIKRLPYKELIQYTRLANLGITLDKDTNINYRYSLPNKLFDYIHAGIPVLASRLPEIARIVEGYQIGCIAENHHPEYIAGMMNQMLNDEAQNKIWKNNLVSAARDLNWAHEEKILIELYQKYA
jgi:glycosyltransferase involved in cell wall biosynthesis